MDNPVSTVPVACMVAWSACDTMATDHREESLCGVMMTNPPRRVHFNALPRYAPFGVAPFAVAPVGDLDLVVEVKSAYYTGLTNPS